MVIRTLVTLVVVGVLALYSRPVSAQGTVHVVQPGENLYRIGLRYGTSWQALMAYNGLASTQIYVGQALAIPGVTALLAALGGETRQNPVGSVTHVVQPGETLFAIGLRYDITWHALASANGLSSTRIYVGQNLQIPIDVGQASVQSQDVVQDHNAPDVGQYVVVPGDTLWTVAQHFGLKPGDLAAANGLTLYSWLYAGQVLTVPGGATTGVQLHVQGKLQTLPLDCESRSAVDWAAYFGISIDELGFFWSLPVSDDPDTGFVGDVYGAWGQIPPAPYGVHADPVAAALNRYSVPARAVHNYSWEELKGELDAGRPVIVWVIGHVTGGMGTWYAASSGYTTLVAPYEHTVIVTGYGAGDVTFLDGASVYRRSLAEFLDSWAALGNMAIVAGQ
jgi:LysM repeat protein